MTSLWNDVRFAIRMLQRTPVVTLAAILALALGIGGNTAIFSVVDGVLLRPLPYPDSKRLVALNGRFPLQNLLFAPLSVPEYLDIGTQSRTLAGVGAYTQGQSNLTGGGAGPVHVTQGVASASLFTTLGVQPSLGRGFTSSEERTGADRVVMLSSELWGKLFGGDVGALGKTLKLDDVSYQIIGILPAGFHVGDDAPRDVWTPLELNDPELTRINHFLHVIGRLKAGATPAQLDTDLTAISKRLIEQYPKSYGGRNWSLEARSLLDVVVGDTRSTLIILLGAIAFVLLIACANVANLMLARAAARTREMAIRTAVGAPRKRLMQQMLTEALFLSCVGGALGLLFGVWGVDSVVAMCPDALPRPEAIGLDWRVLAFTTGVSLLTGVAVGIIPALSVSRPDLTLALKEGSRGATASRGRLRRALVIVEIALSLMLLVGAGLMARSFVGLRHVDPGFRPDHVLTMRVVRPEHREAPTAEQKKPWDSFYERATERLAQLPGVYSVGASTILPLDGSAANYVFEIENYVPSAAGDLPAAEAREIEGDYFKTIGVPLLRGRLFGKSDDFASAPVVVINQAMAQRWWPHEDAVGKHLKVNLSSVAPTQWATVVGVVGNTRGFGLDEPPPVEMYFWHRQSRQFTELTLAIRTVGEPSAIVPEVRRAIGEIDSEQPVFNVQTMTDYVRRWLAPYRFSLALMAIFAAMALSLAVIGIYGVMSYSVAQRTQEIGIRMALGASPKSVLSMVLMQGLVLVVAGIGVGIAGALALTRVLSSMLYGVSATDPLTFVAIAVALTIVALVATLIPAWRATRVDPMLALRSD